MQLQRPNRFSFCPRPSGFSLLELMIVASLCAIVFTTGSLAYRAISQNQRRINAFQTIPLSPATTANFFPNEPSKVVDSCTAPNYVSSNLASQMRNLFHEDVESGCAVFCLPRVGNINTIRERVITIGTLLPAVYDTPQSFLDLLSTLSTTSTRANVFRSYRGAPSDVVGTTPLTNGTIFILQTSNSSTELWLRAVYEIDYVPYIDTANQTETYPSGVPCVYACVRRFVESTLTQYYDVVFKESTAANIGIPFVHYERAVRTKISESTSIQQYKIAGNQPFYQIWWPDPAVSNLKSSAVFTGVPSYAVGSLRADYAKHEGQTSLSIIIPQFPCY